MPKATFVLGPPDAGKTTTIRKMLPEAVHVAVDWSDDPREVGKRAQEAERAFRAALKAGRDVAVESVSDRELERRALEALGAGHEIKILRLPCGHPRRVTPEGRNGTFRCLDCGAEGAV